MNLKIQRSSIKNMPAVQKKVQLNYVWTGKMLAFYSDSQCSESSHLNKSILMREAIVFQTSSTRLKETEFLQSLVATTNIAACLSYLNLAKSSCVSVLGSNITRPDPNIFIALGWHLVSPLDTMGYHKVIKNLYWSDIDRSSGVNSISPLLSMQSRCWY